MPRRVFYGWYIVAAVMLISMTTSGLAFYNLSILLDAFVSERGFPVGLASSATASYFVASGIGGVIAGRLVDRLDPRLVIAASATLSALVLTSVGAVHETWQLYAFHVVFGLFGGATGLVPVTTLVARWFNVRRALALSIASTGLSLGGMLVAPFVGIAVQRMGLSGAGPWMGIALFLGVVPVTLLVVRPSPASMGLEPDGASLSGPGAAPPQPAVAYAHASRSRFFLGVSLAYMFLLGAQVGAIAHLYRLVNLRAGVATAALALACLAAASTIGRLAGGWLLLKIASHRFALALMAVQAGSLALMAVAVETVTLLASVVVFGVTMGNSLMMQPLLLAERFGTRDYGRIYATSQLVTMVGVAGGPALVGLLYEASGGYAAPFLVIAAVTLLGLAALGAADRE